MTKKNGTKRSLLMSALALVLCLSMLVGSTFAWFTDSVTSSGNKIQAGTLDVDLYQWTSTAARNEITNESAPIFGGANSLAAQNNNADTLWEPGKTQVAYLSIKNNGGLALKYKVSVNVVNPDGGKNLYEVMKYAIVPDAMYGTVDSWNSANGKAVVLGLNATDFNNVELLPETEHFFALAIHMDETATNEYQGGAVEFDIEVLATQLTAEEDSFGPDYDALAAYPGSGLGMLQDGETAVQIPVSNNDGGSIKLGSVVVPAEAIADPTKPIEVNYDDCDYEGNFTVEYGMEKTVVDITVSNLKEGNTTPVKATIKIPEGIDPATVKLYHYDDEVADAVYNPNTGYVNFESATFSPFTVVYDADSKYVPPVVPEDEEGKVKYPVATVTYEAQYVNTDLPWGSFGGFAPTTGLDSQLEAAFTFTCPNYDEATDEDKAIIDAYRNWYCDFFVSLSTDLGEDEIFLGGNYGNFGWVGFHNGELTLEAGTELPLLSSVTTNPWIYSDVESLVGTFTCGVGDVDNALEGAAFTVKLRLINPEKVDTSVEEWWTTLATDAYVDVNVVTYTFGGDYTIS